MTKFKLTIEGDVVTTRKETVHSLEAVCSANATSHGCKIGWPDLPWNDDPDAPPEPFPCALADACASEFSDPQWCKSACRSCIERAAELGTWTGEEATE